jgi:hypothetical protein
MVQWFKSFVNWFLKFYWAFFYIWIITAMQLLQMNVPSGLLALRNWLVIVVGAIFGIGFLSLWAGNHDFLKR